jgi:hypothetical protein
MEPAEEQCQFYEEDYPAEDQLVIVKHIFI